MQTPDRLRELFRMKEASRAEKDHGDSNHI